MDISFQTLVFTDIPSVTEWNEQHNINPKKPTKKKVYTPSKVINYPEYQIVKITLFMLYLCIAGVLGFFFPQGLILAIILGVILSVVMFAANNMSDYNPPSLPYDYNSQFIGKRFLFVGEKIHFSEEGIKTSNFYSKAEYSFLYAEMSEIVLQYVGMKAEWDISASKISWKQKEKYYEYYLKIDSHYHIKRLIEVLQFLYKKNMPFQEVNEDGKKLYLLRLIEPPKPEKKKEIAPEILSLIEEIGDKEE